jgi:xylulokinase
VTTSADPDCVLAIDIGTQSTRAALVTRDATIKDCATSPVSLFAPSPGHAEQDPLDWWRTTVGNIRTVLARNPGAKVAAVGTGAQMHSAVPVDEAAEPLARRVGLWSDKRPTAQVAAFRARPDAGKLAAAAGNVPLPAWSGFKIAWFRDEMPHAYQRARAFVVPKDFVNLRLCGVLATDPSEASGTFLADAATGQWSEELAAALGVDRSLLPPLAASGDVIGGVLPQVAEQTGLPAGTPVVAGGGDMLCQLLAAGVTMPGRTAEVAGTASIVASYADGAHPDPRVMSLRTVSGGWVNFGIGDAAGNSLRWLADLLLPAGQASPGGNRYRQLDDAAAAVPPGCDALLFFPYLLGERTLGPADSRGSFTGLTLEHGPGHLARAVMEGICYENRRALDLIAPGRAPLRCTGGGSRSALWNQIRADIYERPVFVLPALEGGIIGAALLAGVGAGWYDNPAAAADEHARPVRSWQPRPETAAAYRSGYSTFRSVHDLLSPQWARWGR